MLFPHRVKQLLLPPVKMGRIPTPHTNEAHIYVDVDGERWVGRLESNLGCEGVLAEALACLLAPRAGVPLPEAAYTRVEGDLLWLSRYVGTCLDWNTRYAHALTNAEELGAMLALDALLINEARHARNILLTHDRDHSVRVWAIDFEEALIGHPEDFAAAALRPVDQRNHARGLPVELLTDGAKEAAERLRSIGASELRPLVEEACEIAREPKRELLYDALMHRAAHAVSLVDDHVTGLRNVS